MWVSSYAKGYYWSCGLLALHICNLRASRHNLLSYPQNGDNMTDPLKDEKCLITSIWSSTYNHTYLHIFYKVVVCKQNHLPHNGGPNMA
jgi:hypothetical protein